jgi:hypothetical protein
MAIKNTPLLSTILLIIFNLIDTFFTVKYIKYGPLDEGNPIMDILLQSDSCLFAFFKIFFTTMFIIFLYLKEENKFARNFLYILTGFYGMLIIWWLFVILMI